MVLGAGASVHAGIPSTKDVTNRIGAIKDNATIQEVVRILQQHEKDGFNFESVMAALEDLQEYEYSKRCNGRLTRGTLSAFTELASFNNKSGGFFTTWHILINSIYKLFSENCTTPSENLKSFFDLMEEHFELTVLTLNYDDLIDHTGPWFDGFQKREDTDDYCSFNACQFVRRVTVEPKVLLHLHGSVRFGYSSQSSLDIVKYASVEKGFDSIKGIKAGLVRAAPIISGHQKERWLQRYTIPLGYYYNAFVNAAVSTPLWVIAGYGANDLHVNTWVLESMRIHKEEARVIIIDQSESAAFQCNNYLSGANTIGCPRVRFLCGSETGNFPPSSDKVGEIINFLKGESN